MDIQRTDHLAIICSDYKRSKDFYTKILGFEIVSETFRKERNSYKLDLRLPGGFPFLEVFSFPNPPPRGTQPEACGLRHIGFTVVDVDSARTYLQSKNVMCEPIRMDTVFDRRLFFAFDPDTLPIEFAEPPKNI
jgi:glyoxylase I family protein